MSSKSDYQHFWVYLENTQLEFLSRVTTRFDLSFYAARQEYRDATLFHSLKSFSLGGATLPTCPSKLCLVVRDGGLELWSDEVIFENQDLKVPLATFVFCPERSPYEGAGLPREDLPRLMRPVSLPSSS